MLKLVCGWKQASVQGIYSADETVPFVRVFIINPIPRQTLIFYYFETIYKAKLSHIFSGRYQDLQTIQETLDWCAQGVDRMYLASKPDSI